MPNGYILFSTGSYSLSDGSDFDIDGFGNNGDFHMPTFDEEHGTITQTYVYSFRGNLTNKKITYNLG